MTMNPKSMQLVTLAALLLVLLAVMAGARPVGAASQEDTAMFYEELGQYGAWVKLEKYGQVWYPTTVSENWRPYVDGRWVPSNDGWFFETDEAWGWATYHFGNWMPTEEYGWVWVPGNTWYPSTAAWRTSDDYIGWAPVPPLDYVPTPAYAPVGGYYPGIPFLDLISPPFWTFAPASNFLLGFGQPFGPNFSFYNSGFLAPFNFIPALFPRTAFINDFFFFPFAGLVPRGFFFFGPPFGLVARAANIEVIKINNFAGAVNINTIHGALPAQALIGRQPFFRQAIPAAVFEGRGLQVQRAQDLKLAVRNLNRPDIVRQAGSMAGPVRETPEVIRGLRRDRAVAAPEVMRGRGLNLPPQALQEPRVMQQQLRGLRQAERALPRAQQQRLQREEQLIRRQGAFRQRPVPRTGPVQPQMVTPRIQPQEIHRGGQGELIHRGGSGRGR